MTEENKAIVICKLPKQYHSLVEGGKTIYSRGLKEWENLQMKILGGPKKVNYDTGYRGSDEGFDFIGIDVKIPADIFGNSIKTSHRRAEEMAALVSKNSTGKGQVICLPEQLKLDPDREVSPEIIDGYLHAKDGEEVSMLIDMQNWLKKKDYISDRGVIKKNDENCNLFIVNEHFYKNKLTSLLLQQINYSGNYIELGASVLENGGVSKPITLKLAEGVANSTRLLSLVEHLKYHRDERAYFKVLADVETNYQAKGGIVKTKSIKILEITEDGLDKYRH